jgi:hypothetical protein
MDFFDRQARAQRNTKLLVFYFVLAVLLIILAIYLAVHFLLPVASAFAHTRGSHRLGFGSGRPLWDPNLFLWVPEVLERALDRRLREPAFTVRGANGEKNPVGTAQRDVYTLGRRAPTRFAPQGVGHGMIEAGTAAGRKLNRSSVPIARKSDGAAQQRRPTSAWW